jgi:hypothetical protein
MRNRANENLPQLRGLFEPSSEIHGVTHHRVLLATI